MTNPTDSQDREARRLHSQRLQAVGQLAGGTAHDLNNVLTVILGEADGLLEDVADPALRDRVRTIQDAAFRAAGLSRDLMDFSRQETDEPELVELNRVVEETQRFVARGLGDDVALEKELEEPSPLVPGRQLRFQQVLVNLLLNAQDAMDEGGRIRVRTRWAGDFVRLEVEDDGCGMDSDAQAQVFDPYFTTKAAGEGTGLGLTMVRTIVEGLGGSIELWSAPGRGTMVSVVLPAARTPVQESPPEGEGASIRRPRSADPRPGGSGSKSSGAPADPSARYAPVSAPADRRRTILLVDDDAAVRRSAERILERAGYRVLVAASGSEALRLCRPGDGPPDLVVTDVSMAGMDGIALARAIEIRWPGVPVIFASGDTGAARARATGTGGPGRRHYLAKPFHPDGLAKAVADALEG